MIMRTEDHYMLASKLIGEGTTSRLNTLAFLIGNIEPDYNRFSYLGPRSAYFSQGHSFKARRRMMKRFFLAPYTHTPMWWFHAGKVFHYMTDSFSRPHNPEFQYDSPHHIVYELDLQKLFETELNSRRWKIPVIKEDPYDWLVRRHNTYLKHSEGFEEDICYICTTIPALWEWVIENKVAHSRKTKQRYR